MNNPPKKFSKIILLLGGALIGLLALAVALLVKLTPDMSKYQDRTTEAQTKIDLQLVRTYLTYYKAQESTYPATLDALSVLANESTSPLPLPAAKIPHHHPDSNQVTYVPRLEPNDAGGWGYVNNPKDKDFGRVFINCTHADSQGTVWASK